MAAQILSDRIILTVADAEVTIFLFGATVTSWKAKGQERLFASNKTSYAGPKAIRAGIPLVFPQFGPGKLPQHGFARVSTWSFLGIEVKNDAQVTVSFGRYRLI